mgnify:FL=1|jgi:hypothetical protein
MSNESKISEVIDVMQTLEVLSMDLRKSYAEECEVVEKIAQDVWDCANNIRADLDDLEQWECA